jgi:hypothetical protein
MKVVVVKGAESGPIQSRKISGQLDIFVKLMAMINAAGNISRTVLLVADESIPVDKFYAHPLKAISSGARVGDYGWIVFTHTRDACTSFWKFYFEHICLPEIQDVLYTLSKNTLVQLPANQRSCLTLDGELKVLRAAMDPHIEQLFREHRVDVVKVGAGHTAISNALDVSTFFRTMKRKLKRFAKTGVTLHCTLISTQMAYIYKMLRTVHSIRIPSLKRHKITQAVTVIAFCLNNGGYTMDVGQRAFISAGQHIERSPKEADQRTVDAERIIRKGYAEVTEAEMKLMMDNLDHFCGIFKVRGQVTDAVFDEKNIPRLREALYKQRDALHLQQQRAVLISHDETVRRVGGSLVKPGNSEAGVRKLLSQLAAEKLRKEKAAAKKVADADKSAGLTLAEKKKLKDKEKADKSAVKQAKENAKLAAVAYALRNGIAGEYDLPPDFLEKAAHFVPPAAAGVSSIISSAACPIVATADYDEAEEDDEEEVEEEVEEEEYADEDSDDNMDVVG